MASKNGRSSQDHLGVRRMQERNYITKKNRRNDPDRLEMKKFCPRCRTHTAHRGAR